MRRAKSKRSLRDFLHLNALMWEHKLSMWEHKLSNQTTFNWGTLIAYPPGSAKGALHTTICRHMHLNSYA